MARGKGKTCLQGGEHQMVQFKVTRGKKQRKNGKRNTAKSGPKVTTSGTRCKWCKKPGGKYDKSVKEGRFI